jgi:PAS domain S-box-containing protein
VAAPLSVLLLEDNPDDADLLVFELRRAGFVPSWRRVDSQPDFLDALGDRPQIILADYSLPQFNALDALHLLRTGGHDIPAIVVSGAMSEEACVDALRHGAVDYLLKDRLTRLGAAVRHALAQQGLIAVSRAHEQRFRAAFDHAPIGMAVTDLSGRVVEVNRALLQMTGLGPDAAITDVIAEEDRPVVAQHAKLLQTGEANGDSYEVRLCRADGRPAWGQYSASRIGGDDGHIVHQIADVTDRRRAEQALQRSVAELARTNNELQELDRLKSDFIATVSHELRTPLTSIRGYTEILADDPNLGGTQRKIVDIIDRNGQRLLTLIEDLLTFSSIESGTLCLASAPVALRQLVDGACEAVRPSLESAGLTLTVAVPADLPTALGDVDQLERVLLNLLSNAVKFSHPGGTVRVAAEAFGDEVVISVCDEGVGIPEHEQAALFTRFYRTADAQHRAIGGSGLGLAICKAIVEAHGGWIALESVVGSGTVIRFALPLKRD